MSGRLNGRTALVTGGARGIGETIVRAFVREGEIAPTAVMPVSDEGAYYIGATLNPNGGDAMV